MSQPRSEPVFDQWIPAISSIGEDLLRHQKRKFELDNIRKPVYELVFNYFTNNETFLTADPVYSFEKSLLICGDPGTGKSLMMKIYSVLFYNEHKLRMYEFVDSFELVREFLIDGFGTIDKFSKKHFYQRKNHPKGLCIDDLGMENTNVVNYGNKVNVIEQILFARHKLFLSDGMKTHATTNCAEDKLGTLYGPRMADRFVELYNVIVLDSPSLRK